MTDNESQVEPSSSEKKKEVSFSDLGLSPPLLKAIEELGYKVPTPIQQQAIPPILMTRDLLGIAQTGTGKTASFLLPILEILSTSNARARLPRALILEPTRELALQVSDNLREYARHLKIRSALLIGGETISAQKEQIAQGPDILIATPGRLCDLFDRGLLLLNSINMLIIDEADRMFDMGFMPEIERILQILINRRQTLLFSATMLPPVAKIADNFLHNPKKIVIAKQSSLSKTIKAVLILLQNKREKRDALEEIIKSNDVKNAIIFCNRKTEVDTLTHWLTNQGYKAEALHGSKHQATRFATLEKFRNDEIQYLVCTDIAARGIDIDTLSHVINYDIPMHAEDYVHRIGRTGRAGLQGHAYSLATNDDMPVIKEIEKLTGTTIPQEAYKTSREERKSRPHDITKTRQPRKNKRPTSDDLPPAQNAPGTRGFGEHVPSFMKNLPSRTQKAK